jgi:hypothetical protein
MRETESSGADDGREGIREKKKKTIPALLPREFPSFQKTCIIYIHLDIYVDCHTVQQSKSLPRKKNSSPIFPVLNSRL